MQGVFLQLLTTSLLSGQQSAIYIVFVKGGHLLGK